MIPIAAPVVSPPRDSLPRLIPDALVPGTARIENVPPGPQTVQVWHPELGRQSRPVDVRTGETSAVTIEMTSAAS